MICSHQVEYQTAGVLLQVFRCTVYMLVWTLPNGLVNYKNVEFDAIKACFACIKWGEEDRGLFGFFDLLDFFLLLNQQVRKYVAKF